MNTANPGQTTIITVPEIPSGSEVGFQVQKAASGTVAIGRTLTGVIERPLGTGNYVINFIAPVEGDLYLVIVDWNNGVLEQTTSIVLDLQVAAEVELGATGLGAIADYASVHLGGETWSGLVDSSKFGTSQIARAISIVKAQTMNPVPVTADEAAINPVALDYLGILAAIQLIPAARDMWAQVEIQRTFAPGEASEIVTYANRAKLMDDLMVDLLAARARAQAIALPFLTGPIVRDASSGPQIDEIDDCKVSDDPRRFPRYDTFPGRGGGSIDSINGRVLR